MFGGRGGGGRGGGSKRASFPLPPPPHRPTSRLSLGGSGGPSQGNPRNNRSGPASASTSSSGNVEETFTLVSGRNSRSFAVVVKLVPGLVEELRRAETLGGTPSIKFDSSGGNPTGNVIDVGGKEFKFTWSSEVAELCDIYEEQESGRDGDGLLVESGSCCRKVNVQRILDESTTNQVKMRSEEAERKLKSRKAIVLEPGNTLNKGQIKQMAAVESNPWKTFKHKKASFKKQKVEASQGARPSKSTFKSGSASATVKGRRSLSPMSSPAEHSSFPASAFGTGSISRNQRSTEGAIVAQIKSKENTTELENEMPTGVSPARRVAPCLEQSAAGLNSKGDTNIKPLDLESMLITLLKENPKGMNLKALNEAVGSTFQNSVSKIEPILKRIATLQGPGRYLLKPGLDLESSKKFSYASASSPEDNHQNPIASKDRHEQGASGIRFEEKSLTVGSPDQPQSNFKSAEVTTLGKIDIQQQPPDLIGNKKASDDSEGQAGSSSDSGSGSDSRSESSDSESDSGSRSRSRSRSPVGSGSGSSSDSESDASSNSKEASDEDVDIMSDDDKKVQQNVRASDPGFPGSPDLWKSTVNDIDEKEDDEFPTIEIEGHVSNAVDIDCHDSDAFVTDKDFDDNDEKKVAMVQNGSLDCSTEDKGLLEVADHDVMQDHQTLIGRLFGSTENFPGESFGHEVPRNSEVISKGKPKRGPSSQFDEKLERSKKVKSENLVSQHVSRDLPRSESPHCREIDNNFEGPAAQANKAEREGDANYGFQKAYNQAIPRKPNPEFQQLDRRSSDQTKDTKAPDTVGRSKYTESAGHGGKVSEQVPYLHDGSPFQKEKGFADARQVNNLGKDKKITRNTKEGNVGGRTSGPFDSNYRKQGEIVGRPNDAVPLLNSHNTSSPNDGNKISMDQLKTLKRELSDLEQGEFREPLPEETPVKKQFERKSSFKQSESRASTSDNCNSDSSKGKPVGKVAFDSGKPSPPDISAEYRNAGENGDKSSRRCHQKASQSVSQNISRGDNAEVGSQFSKMVELGGRLKQSDAGTKLGSGTEGQGEGPKKGVNSVQPPQENKRGLLPHSAKEGKIKPRSKTNDLIEGRKDALSEGNNSGRRNRESSLEEDSSYSKYERDSPELKGPIKDFNQYKEYVQEYNEKYDSYCALNKILENYRNEFHQLGKDLESAKGGDMERYHRIVAHLKESYSECGPRHKRLKKIFVVLHEELKNLKQRIKDFAVMYSKD